jgi:AmmeMemoRadiSam system protein A
MVPLAFLWEACWRGPTAILALPWEPEGAHAMGQALAALPGRTAVIASGDMSHRLKPGAPSGYHPRAAEFDRAFVNSLISNDWSTALQAESRELAAEDVIESTAVAMGAVPGPLNAEVLSYEGPWGVGYAEAILYDPEPPLYAVARAAIRARIEGRKAPVPAGGPTSSGVFVTLRRGADLRGCIGHLAPVHEQLYAEVADVARASAFEDPRFPPLEAGELQDLRIETSLLEPSEPVTDLSSLDPTRWGIVVSAGRRRGVLLPDIEGVDTVDQQVAICRRKAGIGRDEPIRVERFSVRKEVSP